MNLDFNDFQKQDVKFDIDKLQKAYKEILEIRDFSGPEGISNFGAISLTQIPGDPDSIKGHKARGIFWFYSKFFFCYNWPVVVGFYPC